MFEAMLIAQLLTGHTVMIKAPAPYDTLEECKEAAKLLAQFALVALPAHKGRFGCNDIGRGS